MITPENRQFTLSLLYQEIKAIRKTLSQAMSKIKKLEKENEVLKQQINTRQLPTYPAPTRIGDQTYPYTPGTWTYTGISSGSTLYKINTAQT